MVIIDGHDPKIWEEFNLKFHPASFLQSWAGGETHARLGKKIIRRAYFNQNKLRAIGFLIGEEARRGRHFLCPGGPVLDWSDQRLAGQVLADLKKIGQQEKALFIRVRPNVPAEARVVETFRQAGFRHAPMHLEAETTWELALEPSLEKIFAQMRKGHRQAIEKTRQAGVAVETSRASQDARLLAQLQQEAVSRHKFVPFSAEYFQAHAAAFLPDNLVFYKAFLKNELWAIAMIVFYGRVAFYHYAASKTSPPGISPPTLILWQAIQDAKMRGCQIFNFWGVAPSDDPKHRFFGVTQFKKGFGGGRVFYLPAQDLPLSRLYLVDFGFETLRRIRRKL